MPQPLIALDIGSTKVACAIGWPHEQGPGFELMGTSLVAYPNPSEGWMGDPLMVSRAIEQAIETTAIRADVQRALVSVSHPSLKSERTQVALTLSDEPVTIRTQDLDRLQRSALHQALGIDREALMVERLACSGNGFSQVRDPHGLCATRLQGIFHIVTMPIAVRRALTQAVEATGLEIARLTYTLPALWASVADDALRQQRVLVIDIGGLSMDVGLFCADALEALEVVPAGGMTLATTIAKQLQVTMEQAITWSLEGTGCRKPGLKDLTMSHWSKLQQAIETVLKNQPRPDHALVMGRGVLVDGLVEWLERTTKIPMTLSRSARTSTFGELSRQVGLSAAIGLLEIATRTPTNGFAPHSQPFFNRLLHRTRTILTEYF